MPPSDVRWLPGKICARSIPLTTAKGNENGHTLINFLGQKPGAVVQCLVRGTLRREENNAVVPSAIGLGYVHGCEILHKIIPDAVHLILRQCG